MIENTLTNARPRSKTVDAVRQAHSTGGHLRIPCGNVELAGIGSGITLATSIGSAGHRHGIDLLIMDWQEPVALGIVVLTAGCFLWSRLRPKKPFQPDTHCGCHAPGAGSTGNQPSMVFKARKGKRPQIIVRNQRSQ